MKLNGSCHCGAVRFSVESNTPVPYQRCYCSICRKTQGSGGYAINLGADAATLVVEGRGNTAIYHARMDGGVSQAERHFCRLCGSHLWLFDARWPNLVHPHASAIDSDLPKATETTHLMLDFKADWVDVAAGPGDRLHGEYPDESIDDWHTRTGSRVE
ncbi:MAG: GFA family protein [Phyllobacteriaceae bacterium]|nr:GFA family protein [Phyllobacteriaceae bacterium]